MSQPVVLLVEDKPARRVVLSYNVKAEGFQVLEATDGEDAVLHTLETLLDLIVSDWKLPRMTVPEVCRRLNCG